MKKSIYAIMAFTLAASACLAQQQQEPSLGDLAKQHRDEKKPVKVFTNEDVATSSPSPAAESPRSAAPAAVTASSAAASGNEAKTNKKESDGKTAANSKDTPEVAELKQKLSSYKEQQDGWKKSAKKYQDLLATETSDFRRQMYQDALQGDQQNVQFFQDKIDQAQSDLAKAEKASSSNH
jgi:hypothetical protein